MASKLIFICVLFIRLVVALAQSNSQYYYSKTAPYVPPQEQLTNLHFYFHHTIGVTALVVARANLSDKSPVSFGAVFAVDDPLTVGPEMTSEVIGNERGMYVKASRDLKVFNPVVYLDFGFISGEFSGSSISVFSRNPVMEKQRELAVVGGRGKFQMARGFARLTTYSISQSTAIVEYNVTVIHYLNMYQINNSIKLDFKRN